MNIENFIYQLNREIKSLTHNFQEMDDFYSLRVNEKKIKFKKANSIFSINQKNWFREAHENNNIYEKGLISTLTLIGKIIKSKVIFYDIGALFGYHTIIANSFLNLHKAIIVEANPHSHNVIKKVLIDEDNIKLYNVLLSDKNSKKKYYIDLYNFWQADGFLGYLNYFKIRLKNYTKTLLNLYKNKYKVTYDFKRYEINSVTLKDIFLKNTNHYQEIYKIDGEGTQCIFLKPYIKVLSEKKAIVLLELDHPKYMAKFKMTNNEMLKLFLKFDYTAIWLDHREPNEILNVNFLKPSMDKNSFLILLPKNFFDKYLK